MYQCHHHSYARDIKHFANIKHSDHQQRTMKHLQKDTEVSITVVSYGQITQLLLEAYEDIDFQLEQIYPKFQNMTDRVTRISISKMTSGQ